MLKINKRHEKGQMFENLFYRVTASKTKFWF